MNSARDSDKNSEKGKGKSDNRFQSRDRPYVDKAKVCITYNLGKCTPAHSQCALIRNPTCKIHNSDKGCRSGDECLSPHHGQGGIFFARSEPSKRLVASEAKKAQDAASWEAVPAGGPNANGHRQGQLQAPKSDKLGKVGRDVAETSAMSLVLPR